MADLSSECVDYATTLQKGTKVIVMHSPETDTKWLMDSESILMSLEDTDNYDRIKGYITEFHRVYDSDCSGVLR